MFIATIKPQSGNNLNIHQKMNRFEITLVFLKQNMLIGGQANVTSPKILQY